MTDSDVDGSVLDDAASKLYAVDPSEFVAARKAAADAAKKSGDRKLAAAIGKLRKPTTVGWMVNLLVREEPDDVVDLFDLGDRLRDAQRRSDAAELRSLSAERQQLIRALSTRTAKLVEQQGHSSTESAIREVGQTLGAALADPDIAQRVRAGAVVTAETYSGFGPAALSLVPDSDDDTDTDTNRATGSDSDTGSESAEDDMADANDEALADALGDLDEAREDEDAARKASEAAAEDAERAAAQLLEIKERLARLRAELHEAEEQEADARQSEKSSERESRRLRRVLTDAQARTAAASQSVQDLRGDS